MEVKVRWEGNIPPPSHTIVGYTTTFEAFIDQQDIG